MDDDGKHIPLKDRNAHLLAGPRPQDQYEIVNGYETIVWVDDFGQKLFSVHSSEECEGRNCCIHEPSRHSMRNMPRQWDSKKRRMMRVCGHGFAHPDPDDLYYWSYYHGEDKSGHDCDGCCRMTEV